MAKLWAVMALPIVLVQGTTYGFDPKKIEPVNATPIIRFTLFNYDRLIQDHYEGTTGYSAYLLYLIHSGTHLPTPSIQPIIQDPELYTEPNPVQFMVRLNKKLKHNTGYYFVDD